MFFFLGSWSGIGPTGDTEAWLDAQEIMYIINLFIREQRHTSDEFSQEITEMFNKFYI